MIFPFIYKFYNVQANRSVSMSSNIYLFFLKTLKTLLYIFNNTGLWFAFTLCNTVLFSLYLSIILSPQFSQSLVTIILLSTYIRTAFLVLCVSKTVQFLSVFTWLMCCDELYFQPCCHRRDFILWWLNSSLCVCTRFALSIHQVV